jgi:hypothetical protein
MSRNQIVWAKVVASILLLVVGILTGDRFVEGLVDGGYSEFDVLPTFFPVVLVMPVWIGGAWLWRVFAAALGVVVGVGIWTIGYALNSSIFTELLMVSSFIGAVVACGWVLFWSDLKSKAEK